MAAIWPFLEFQNSSKPQFFISHFQSEGGQDYKTCYVWFISVCKIYLLLTSNKIFVFSIRFWFFVQFNVLPAKINAALAQSGSDWICIVHSKFNPPTYMTHRKNLFGRKTVFVNSPSKFWRTNSEHYTRRAKFSRGAVQRTFAPWVMIQHSTEKWHIAMCTSAPGWVCSLSLNYQQRSESGKRLLSWWDWAHRVLMLSTVHIAWNTIRLHASRCQVNCKNYFLMALCWQRVKK